MAGQGLRGRRTDDVDVDAPWLPCWAHDDGGLKEGGRGDGEDDVRDEPQDDATGRESQKCLTEDNKADGFTKELTGAKLAKSNELMLGDAGGGASE